MVECVPYAPPPIFYIYMHTIFRQSNFGLALVHVIVLCLYPTGFIPSRTITFLAILITSFACLTSVYLVYILFYILEMICLVCMPVHFINLALFILFTIKWSSPPGKATSSAGTNSNTKKSPAGQTGKKKKSKKEQ